MSLAKRPRLAPPEPQPSLLEQLYDKGLAGKKFDDACDSFPSWSVLPLEVLVHVFGFLTPQERRRYMIVCRQWYRAMSIPSLWKRSWVSIRSGLASKPPQLQALIQQRKPFGVKLFYSHSDLEKLHELHPHLQGLHLTFKYTLQCPLSCLLSFSDLKVLKLESNDSTPLISVSTMQLERLRCLRELYFINIPVFVFQSTFPSHSTLSHLVLNKCGSLTPSFTCSLLDLLPQLTSLHITHSSYYHGFVHSRSAVKKSSPVVNGTDITSLSLYNTSFSGCDTGLHRRLQCLHKFDLSYCQQDEDQLRHLLVPLCHLEELNLTGQKLTVW